MRKALLGTAIIANCFAFGCQSAPAKHYPIEGEVISVDAPKRLLTVKHGDTPGLMPGMTMSYAVVEEKEIQTLKPGDKISADLVVSDNVGRLEKIVQQPKTNGSDGAAMPSRTN